MTDNTDTINDEQKQDNGLFFNLFQYIEIVNYCISRIGKYAGVTFHVSLKNK